MPRSRPILDFSQIRNYAEKFHWIDPVTGVSQTGFNPPPNALDKRRASFSITFLTEKGVPYRGRATCISVNTRARSRKLQFVEDAHVCIRNYQNNSIANSRTKDDSSIFKVIRKGEIRQVSDILIVEIDGVRFSAS